jgi:predicted nucleic acid-binding protein
MGSLEIAPGSLVYLDTVTIIYSVEMLAEFWPRLQPLWKMSASRQLTLCTSELALHETLVGPLKRNNKELADDYAELLSGSDVRMLPITRPVLQLAAQLRADTGVQTPDAIHAATALLAACDVFLSNDADFRRIAKLPLRMVVST